MTDTSLSITTAPVVFDTYLVESKILNEEGKDVAIMLQQLSDPTRLRLCWLMLSDCKMNVGTLALAAGASQPAVSHHLSLMSMAGIIELNREGQENFYRLTDRFGERLRKFALELKKGVKFEVTA